MVNVHASCLRYRSFTSDQQPLPLLACSLVILLSQPLLLSWHTEEILHPPRLGVQVTQHQATSGMGTRSFTFPRTVGNHFLGSSRAFKVWVGSRRGDNKARLFRGKSAYVRKLCGRDGWQHCGAHVIIQASVFWLLLYPRERQAQKSRKQLINFLTWPRNQTDRFQRELQPSGRDCGREG